MSGGAPDLDPPTARWGTVRSLIEDREAPRHPSDGGGRAWLEPVDGAPPLARARQPGTFTVVYEAGPLGIAEGGLIALQVSPYWGWSTPWSDHGAEPVPEGARDRVAGFTEVTTDARGVELSTVTPFPEHPLLMVGVGGRALRAGEQVRFVYGAGARGAHADTYAERESMFWIAVDGDGDGVRKLIQESPSVRVLPGPPARMELILPSCVAPGEEARLTLSVLDARGSAGVDFEGSVLLEDVDPSLGLPDEIVFSADDGGCRTLTFRPTEAGLFRLLAVGPDGLAALSNPMFVEPDVEPVLWGDLHGHTALSDGTGTPHDYFAYARDVAALDVVALTDHDHWGFLFLDEHPELVERIVETVRAFHDPGRFVALMGYEWTNWVHGHRHVVGFGEPDDVPLLSSLDERYETPAELWAALDGEDVLTFAHHSAGAPVPTNWTFVPDPQIEPVTEIMSVHGSSESLDSPMVIRGAVPGNFVRDVLDRGVRFGFVGSGDSHDGHPGLTHHASGTGGVVALLTGDRTRAGVLEALRARRCYATSGARILLRTALDGHRMGATLGEAPEGPATLTVVVHGTHLLERLDVIRSGTVTSTELTAEATADVVRSFTLDDLRRGEYVYVRVVQADGQVAWSSPFFVGRPADGD